MKLRTRYARRMVEWWGTHKRSLPWRNNPTPYQVWIAEVMLQQTQAQTVAPYFIRWMKRLPTLDTLARARLQTVLKLWEGLGYYRRAHHVHRAAVEIMHHFGGELPKQEAQLRSLPGIGRYSAGAILSMGWGIPAAAVDANVARVLGRFIGLRYPAASPQGQHALWGFATRLILQQNPGALSESLIELGALVCKPRHPQCPQCPLQPRCRALRTGNPQQFPPALQQKKAPLRIGELVVIESTQGLLIRQRPVQGLWGGLWELPWRMLPPLPNSATPPPSPKQLHSHVAQQLKQNPFSALPVPTQTHPTRVLQHTLTHMRLCLQIHSLKLQSVPTQETVQQLQACFPLQQAGLRQGVNGSKKQPPWRWVSKAELKQLPLAKLSHKALELL